MCGIWALIKQHPELTSKIIDSFNKVRNRGPDSSVLHVDRNYIAGFHRLAINDLSVSGNQPFYHSTQTHNYVLMANGEIYNHHELESNHDIHPQSKSDCAVLLPLFIQLNEDFKLFNSLLRGEYSIVILKQSKSSDDIQFYFSTDPLSVRPLFCYLSQTEIGVSSLLGGLSGMSDDVFRLNQGSYLIGSTDLKTYLVHTIGSYVEEVKVDPTIEENTNLYEQIVRVLRESIRIRLESDRPLGCLLSGGLDSSLVAAIASDELKKVGKRLRTFSIGMEDGTDIHYARMVAKHIDSDHTEFNFTAEQGLEAIEEVIKATETYDITTIRASVGQYLIGKNIAESTDIKVILNGDGADECQMGYIYFYLHPDVESARLERNKLVQQIHMFDGLRVDRNISHHGLEARVPFLDKEFVNLYYSIPAELLVPTAERMEKHLIRTAFLKSEPDLLPYEVLMRKKEAFSDGVSSKEKSWYLIVKEHFNNMITDDEFETRHDLDGLIPLCKESFYYRKRFNELYGQNQRVIPRYWLANWSTSKDPSARTLNIYNQAT